jgi:pyruvyltransferase
MINLLDNNKPIKCYWHACDNFGDAITPYLIKKISNREVQWVPANSDPSLVMVTGSILGCSINKGIVWGAGCAFKSDIDPACFTKPSEEFRIIATRGLLSKKIVEQSGHTPITFGDPGILIPKFYNPNLPKKYDVGIICSWVDYDDVLLKYNNEKIAIINSIGGVEDIINKLLECEVVIASSLHGLIISIAYDIPTVLVKFSDRMIGDGFKFQDFLTCVDRQYEPIDLIGNALNIKDLINLTFVHKLCINVDDLFNCCPFNNNSLVKRNYL